MTHRNGLTLLLGLLAAWSVEAETRVVVADPGAPEVAALQLQDPFFKLVLDRHNQPTRLDEIRATLQPDQAKHHVFVVSERIKDSSQAADNSRRAVMSFSGANVDPHGETVNLEASVMLSFFFTPSSFPIGSAFEAWGWDDPGGRYNYYRIGNQGWEFRGSSNGPDVPERSGCMVCHHNGTPIMKELMRPWPNWHSLDDEQGYLTNRTWPSTMNSDFGPLKGGQLLEMQIISSLRRFHRRQIRMSSEPTQGSALRIVGASRLLSPLFETTEVNLASSRTATGSLHPFSSAAAGPNEPIRIPNTFFLNARVIGNAGPPQIHTLDINPARGFRDVAVVPEAKYAQFVQSRGLRLFRTGGACSASGSPSGDAAFAWLHPEPGLFDVLRVEALLQTGLIDRQFVAAVMAVDLRTPIYSADRAALLRFVPDAYSIQADGSSDLIALIVGAIDAASPASGSPADIFRSRLNSVDAAAALDRDVQAYLDEVAVEFSNPGSPDFDTKLEMHLDRLLAQRQLFSIRPELCDQIEGPAIPVP